MLTTSCRRHNPAPVRDAHYSSKKTSSVIKRNKHKVKSVVVRKGDTLYSIGFSHNIDYKKIANINNIPAPYHIYPGQKLSLVQHRLVKKNSVKKKKPAVTLTKYNPPVIKKPTSIVAKTPVTKPNVKPNAKPNTKPNIKPTVQQQAPSSNSRWIWPVSGKVISTFSQSDVSRKGIDISSPIGKSVHASNNGTVVYSGDGLRGYGELIIIKHSNNLLSAYAHNTSRLVKEGAVVNQGQVIAKSGKGTDGRPLLHFEIRKNGQPVNPLSYLPKQ